MRIAAHKPRWPAALALSLSLGLPSSGQGIAVDADGYLSLAGWTDLFFAVSPIQPTPTDGFLAPLASNSPPDCSRAAASPSLLWPANGKMTPVSVIRVTDPDGDPIAIAITRITQDEPRTGKGPDATGIRTSTVRVRAYRAGNGDGRVYHLTFTAIDPQGASCSGTVTVCVPHDQWRSICGDGGSLVVSTGG